MRELEDDIYKFMKAIEIIEKKLEIKDIELPVLKDNEVLIKVKAAGLNRADIAQKNGLYPSSW